MLTLFYLFLLLFLTVIIKFYVFQLPSKEASEICYLGYGGDSASTEIVKPFKLLSFIHDLSKVVLARRVALSLAHRFDPVDVLRQVLGRLALLTNTLVCGARTDIFA